LWGEGLDNSVIQLDNSMDDSTLNAYVARSADSLQQIGVNIGNNGAITPQYVTVTNMGFVNTDPTTDVFLVQDAVNFRFQNVGFSGPLTQANLTTSGDLTHGVAFASTTSLVCDQIVFDGCRFSGTTYGAATDQQIKGVTFTNSKFDTLHKGINLGTNTVVNGGPTGVRITNNLFDNIYAEGVVFGDVSLNATGYNIFYGVGNHFGTTTAPYTAVINIQTSNNLSVGDMFERSDAYAGSATPGTAYPRITLNNTQSIATTNGSQTEQGTYSRQSGTIFTLYDDDSGTIFTVDASVVSAFSLDYTIVRGTGFRTGTVLVATDGSGAINSSDDFTQNLDTGVAITITQASNIVSIDYTTTSTGTDASYSVSLTRLV
jgi:hypothetical protein